jgi:hypothetical protein
MNIKDFISWRPNCFFCGKSLFIKPDFPRYPTDGNSIAPSCFIEDDLLHFASRYVKMNIDIISGFVQTPGHLANSVDTLGFISNQTLEIRAKCSWCPQHARIYSNVGIFKSNSDLTHYSFHDICENLADDDFCFTQSQRSQTGLIRKSGAHALTSIKSPYIDLSKTTPDKFTNKIKTCITFS